MKTTRHASFLACSLLAATLAFEAVAAAQGSDPAEALFNRGLTAMEKGRYSTGCPDLAESQRLEPHVGTLLNLAACHEREGKVGSAWVEYQKALTAARAEGQAERAKLAAARIKVLEPRVPWLRISSSAEDITIALDGGALEHAAWDHEMPVDPAAHVVTAERRGAKVFEERVELREGEHRSVRVEIIEPLPQAEAERPAQDRVIVEPATTATSAPVPSAKYASPWVFELGVFLGLVGGTARYARGVDTIDSCSGLSCGELKDVSNVAVGANLFAGYALSDTVHLGTRLLVAPGLGSSGAGVYGLGPSIAFRANDRFTIGAWPFFGNATLRGKASAATKPDGTGGPQTIVNAEGDLHGGFGAGIELSLRLFEVGRGEVVLSSTPFFLASSNGTAACLPIGLAYRF